jgi:hypothetical protein
MGTGATDVKRTPRFMKKICNLMAAKKGATRKVL